MNYFFAIQACVRRFTLCALLGLSTVHAAPVVSNLSAAQRTGTKLVDITYDLSVSGTNPTVKLEISSDGGVTWAVPVNTVSGAIGAGISAGAGKLITWDAGTDWNDRFSTQVKARVTAWDLRGPDAVAFARIPGGSYERGNVIGDADSEVTDAPVQTVTLSEYFMQTTEATKAQWDLVRNWASSHGYTDMSAGAGKASNHPVQTINWFDMVKWCNAASEIDGLTPCYYTDDAQTVVYRTGNVNVTNAMVKWAANGYRLPTEAEWEVAARGGLTGKRFPWGNTIQNGSAQSGGHANYYGVSSAYFYDLGPNGYNAAYATGSLPYTSPVGSFGANGYGLYDVAGNAWEWCWDWYGTYSAGTNPRGPSTYPGPGFGRVVRGSSWNYGANIARCAQRSHGTVSDRYDNLGFRPARGRIEGAGGIASSTVTVSTSALILSHPQSLSIAQNAPASFSVTAISSGTLTYQWQKDGVDIPGATSSTFSLANAKPWHIGDYTVKVTDANGTITSNAATLSLTGINSGIWKGLTSYYKLDSEASDRSVLGQDLTISGATPNPDRFSQSIGAFSFNGLGNSIYKSGLTGPDASSAQSISVWFKAGFPINDALLAGSAIDGNARFHISIKNGRLEGAHGNDSNFQYHEFGSATLQSGTWYHAVLTTTGNAGAMNAYLNGVAIGQAPSGTNTALTSNYWIQLGSVASSSFIYNFKGEIDDVRFYNRAISGAEVAALYAAENAPNNWRQTYFGSTSNAGDAADDADPDRDGLKNLLEYALNLSPNAASRVPASVQATGGNLEYTYTRGTAAFNGGTTFQVEWSDDLSGWSSAGVVETLLSDDGTYQQVNATLPAGSGGRRFVRLRVQ